MKHDSASIELRVNLGSRIREIRQSQGLSQNVLSQMIDLDRSYLVGIEGGHRNITVDSLFKISRGLGVPLASLFANVDDFVYAQISFKSPPSENPTNSRK